MLRMDGTSEQISAKSSCLCLEAAGDEFYNLMQMLPKLHSEIALRSFGRKSPLGAILAHPRAMEKFTAFQKTEYASESTEFYTEVTNWRSKSEDLEATLLEEEEPAQEKDPILLASGRASGRTSRRSERDPEKFEKIRRSAVEVVDEFVKEGAMKQINVPASVREQIEKAVSDSDNIDITVFDEAQAEIFNLMKKDTLPRFVQSEMFERLLFELGEESPLPDVKSEGFKEGLAAARAEFAERFGPEPAANKAAGPRAAGPAIAPAAAATASPGDAYAANYAGEK